MLKKNKGRFKHKTYLVDALVLMPVVVLLMSTCRKKGCPACSSPGCSCCDS